MPVPAVESGHPARITLEDVARIAGVSRQTVSNALNAPQRVQPQTLARVREVIDAVDYRPSRAARQLRTRRSHTLAMRLEPTRDGINGSVLDRFLHALVDRAQDDGYHVLLFTAQDDGAERQTFADLLSTADLDGFVLTGTHHGDTRTAWLAERGVPFVTFGRPWGAPEQHPWVDVDGAAGTRRAVEHLVATGHRRIGFLGWPAGSGVGDDRRAGWAAGLAAAGLAGTGLEARVPDGVESGRTAMAGLLDRAEPPTAVVCVSDSLALGALGALGGVGAVTGSATAAGQGTAPPVAVVGFDDTPVAAAVGLTSVAQPLAEAARACLEMLLGQIVGDPPDPPTRLLEPHLVVRRTA